MPTLTVLPLAADAYRVTLRAPDGAVLMRCSGPGGWCLEQVAAALNALSPPPVRPAPTLSDSALQTLPLRRMLSPQ